MVCNFINNLSISKATGMDKISAKVSKIMERLLYNQIFDYFAKKDLLSKHQFGFRPFHSTSSTLLDCTNEWFVNMDRGLYNLVVLLDLKKAFDTVNHEILLHKLQMYGFETKALNFRTQLFLTNRTQRCQLNGLFSDQKEVTCGISPKEVYLTLSCL